MKLLKRISLLPLLLLFVLQVSAATYVASKNSDVYHISTCGQAGKIKDSNLITFSSAAAAEATGRRPCSFCGNGISSSRSSSSSSSSRSSTATKATTAPTTKPSVAAKSNSNLATQTKPATAGFTPLTYTSTSADSQSKDLASITVFLLAVACIALIYQLSQKHALNKSIEGLYGKLNEKEKENKELLESSADLLSKEMVKNKILEDDLESLKTKISELESQCQQIGQLLSDADHEKATLSLSVNRYQTERAELMNQLRLTYGKDFLVVLSGAPRGAYVDSAFLPHRFVSKGDDQYTLHRSPTGKFHTKACTHIKTCTSIPALDVPKKEFEQNRCMVCFPKYPDLSWYYRYLHFLDITK